MVGSTRAATRSRHPITVRVRVRVRVRARACIMYACIHENELEIDLKFIKTTAPTPRSDIRPEKRARLHANDLAASEVMWSSSSSVATSASRSAYASNTKMAICSARRAIRTCQKVTAATRWWLVSRSSQIYFVAISSPEPECGVRLGRHNDDHDNARLSANITIFTKHRGDGERRGLKAHQTPAHR